MILAIRLYYEQNFSGLAIRRVAGQKISDENEPVASKVYLSKPTIFSAESIPIKSYLT